MSTANGSGYAETLPVRVGEKMCILRTTAREMLNALEALRKELQLPEEALFRVLLDRLTVMRLQQQAEICPNTVGDRRCSKPKNHLGGHASVIG